MRMQRVIHNCYPNARIPRFGGCDSRLTDAEGRLARPTRRCMRLLCSGVRAGYPPWRRRVAEFARFSIMARFTRVVRLAGGGTVWGSPGIVAGPAAAAILPQPEGTGLVYWSTR